MLPLYACPSQIREQFELDGDPEGSVLHGLAHVSGFNAEV